MVAFEVSSSVPITRGGCDVEEAEGVDDDVLSRTAASSHRSDTPYEVPAAMRILVSRQLFSCYNNALADLSKSFVAFTYPQVHDERP